MTGFGSGSKQLPEGNLLIEVEINSVNRKTLDCYFNLPRDWSGLEPICQDWLKGEFSRGRVNVIVKATALGSETSGLIVSESALDESIGRLKTYADSRDIDFEVDAKLLLDLTKTLKDSTGLPDFHDHEEGIRDAFDAAIHDIRKMRNAEGASLQKDLLERLGHLESLVTQIEDVSDGASRQYRDALLDRLKQLDLDLDPSDERVLKEIAIFADRCDISEEITRLKSHFEQFRTFIHSDEPTGRKMDFLCQEIHREFNTSGSKTNQIEVTRTVIEGKNALERVREQIQNVE